MQIKGVLIASNFLRSAINNLDNINQGFAQASYKNGWHDAFSHIIYRLAF